MRGSVAFPLGVILLAGMPATASSAPNRRQCVDAYEETQRAMRRSQLLRAREALQVCLDEACASVLRSDCAGWLNDVEARMPTVVVECMSGGSPVMDAQLFVDDEPRRIDGKAMELEPGPHAFRVEVPGVGPSGVTVVNVREGEKLQRVRIEIPTTTPVKPTTAKPPAKVDEPERPKRPLPSPPVKASRPIPWTVYAVSGAGAATAIGFGVFGVTGLSMKSDLEQCKDTCSDDRISAVRERFIVADVFLGLTAVATSLAAYLFLTRPSFTTTATTATTTTTTTSRTAWSFGPSGGRLVF